MTNEMEFFEQKLETWQTPLVQEHSDVVEDEDQVRAFERMFGMRPDQVPDYERRDSEDEDLSEDSFSEEEEISSQAEESEEEEFQDAEGEPPIENRPRNPLSMRNPAWTGTQHSELTGRELVRLLADDLNRIIRQQHDSDWNSLGAWVTLLRHRSNPDRRFVIEDFQNIGDFLSTLGMWIVPEQDVQNFQREYNRQGLIKFTDHLDTRYLWGPLLRRGEAFLLLSDQLEQDVKTYLLAPWRFRAKGAWRKVLRFFQRFELVGGGGRQLTIGFGMAIASYRLVNYLHPLPALLLSFRGNTNMLFAAHPMTWRQPRNLADYAVNAGRILLFPQIMIREFFVFFEQISQRLARGMMRYLLQLLELFGIEVSGFWRSLADLTTDILSEVIIVGLASLFIYAAWKLFQFVITPKKTKKVTLHESKNEDGKGGKQHRQQQKNLKSLRVKAFQHRAFEELQCDSRCDCEDEVVEVDEVEWEKLGQCEDNKSFYSSKAIAYMIESVEDGDTLQGTFIRNKRTHLAVTTESLDDDLKIEDSKFHYAKKVKIYDGDKECFAVKMSATLLGTPSQVKSQWKKWSDRFSELQICDWEGEIIIRKFKEGYLLKLNLVGLTTTIQGRPGYFTKKHLKDLTDIVESIQGKKETARKTVDGVFHEQGASESTDLMKLLVKRHQVYVSRVDLEDIDSLSKGKATHGIGHLDSIILNAHVFKKGDIVRFWRSNQDVEKDNFQLCKIERLDVDRDLAFARILRKEEIKFIFSAQDLRMPLRLASVSDEFRSIEPHLTTGDNWRRLVADQEVLCWLPKTGGVAVGLTRVPGKVNYTIAKGDKLTQADREYLEITKLSLSIKLAVAGDCGGMILSFNDRYQSKLVGFHSGGTHDNWYATILMKEDLNVFHEHACEDDSWNALIVSGAPTDLPQGKEVTFVGKYLGRTKPAGEQSLAHWKYSPWFDQFEEQLQPGPLSAKDSRIKIDLPTNLDGEKSLLLIPNSAMCKTLPMMEDTLLKKIERQLVDEMAMKIGRIKRTPDDLDDLLILGLNGDRENEFCTGMELDKAAGIPWSDIKGCTKKSDFLENNDGYITFRKTMNGDRLKKRISEKIMKAKQGKRIISLSNSKLKDAVIKISAVEQGKTRVFHCIPVDKIVTDACLFGNFKEAYSKAFLKLNHAIGVNPHSRQWQSVYEHLDLHPNTFDLDFTNYDKYLHAELMRTVFNIIRKVIQKVQPDDWDQAREVLQEEAIETYVVDYDTIYKTRRANKSGEYLTTIVNCIANDILSFYVWMKTTGEGSLAIFRKNVSLVVFGDDKVESVSDEYANQYNYLSAKFVLGEIGHTITPGNKDGKEEKFSNLEEVQFLKRGFKKLNGMIVAPLLQRSIESPFMWTQNSSAEIMIWTNLVEASLFEAVLHGEEYYEQFRNRLQKCNDPFLLRELASLLAVPYEETLQKYQERYHGDKIHL